MNDKPDVDDVDYDEEEVLNLLDEEDEYGGINSCDALMILDGVVPEENDDEDLA